MPGKTNHVVFRADEEGTYDGQAATLSGQAYAAMRTEVDVVSPEEYEAFVEQQKTDIQAAQDRVVRLIENGRSTVSARAGDSSSTASPAAARAGSRSRPAPTTRTSAGS